MSFLHVAAAAALQSISAAPQIPIAAGSFKSIGVVLESAKNCGIEQLKVEMYPASWAGDARLYLLQDPKDAGVRCLNSWLTHNGKRLALVPRWSNDGFSSDAP
jgi:hypothetical protein